MKRAIMVIISVLLITCIFQNICYGKTKLVNNSTANISDKNQKDSNIYIDRRFKFSVNYPKKWKSKIEPTWAATSTREASPDGGINIYIKGVKSNVKKCKKDIMFLVNDSNACHNVAYRNSIRKSKCR